MKLRLLLTTIVICCSIGNIYSFETSADSSNLFNKFLDPTMGVDLFSGNAIHTQNLFTLSGRNGLDIDVTLYYSSNIYNHVRSRNDINPTSLVGLGWRFGYGGIVSDHKNTLFIDDDEYQYLSPTGDGERLFQKYDADGDYSNDEFYIQSDPYLKFRRTIVEKEGLGKVVVGWVVTTTSGKKYKYGDLDEFGGDIRNATWNTFCWSGQKTLLKNYIGENYSYSYRYVGNGFTGAPKLYGYRWDLSQIEDVFGNKIRFYYEQIKEGVRAELGAGYNAWESNIKYTKASYPKEIINPQGQKVKFFLGDKYDKEYLDLYTFHPESEKGDAFMENYETKFLDHMEVYNINGNIMKRVELYYDTGSVPVEGITHYTKRRLKEVKHVKVPVHGINPPPERGAEDVYDVRLNYNVDKTRSEDVAYHYGSLSSLQSASGGKTEFGYSRIELQENEVETRLFLNADDVDNNRYGIAGNVGPSASHNVTSAGGILKEGIEYLIYCVNRYNGHLTGILWDGKKWENAFIKNTDDDIIKKMKDWDGLDDAKKLATAGGDFFVVQRAKSNTEDGNFNFLKVFDWDSDNKLWKGSISLPTGSNTIDSTTVFCSSNYFVVAYSKYNYDRPKYIKIFYKFGSGWVESSEIRISDGLNSRIWQIRGQEDYFVVFYEDYKTGVPGDAPGVKRYIKVFNRNCLSLSGSYWGCTFDARFAGDSGVAEVTPNKNFFVVSNKDDENGEAGTKKQIIHIYTWNGTEWFETFKKVYWVNQLTQNIQRVTSLAGDNYALLCRNHQEKNPNEIYHYPFNFEAYNWTGKILQQNENKIWERNFEFQGETYTQTQPPNTIYKLGLNVAAAPNLIAASVGRIPYQISYNPRLVKAFQWEYDNQNGWVWKMHQNDNMKNLPMDQLIHMSASDKYFIALNGQDVANSKIRGYSWNGVKFNLNFDNASNGIELHGAYTIEPSNYGSVMSIIYNSWPNEGANFRVVILKRHNDNIGNLFNYVITRRVLTDGIIPDGIITDIEYSNINFNSTLSTFKIGMVDVRIQGDKWGKSELFFRNEFFANAVTDALMKFKLNGQNYKTNSYRYENDVFSPISDRLSTFVIHKKPDWPKGVYTIRNIKTENILDKLNNKETMDYSVDGCTEPYPDKNGLPRIVRTYNSNNNISTKFQIYAYEIPTYTTAFQSRNLLTQPAVILQLEESSGDMMSFCDYFPSQVNLWYTEISADHIRGASAITWSNDNLASAWAPKQIYTWRVACENAGRPIGNLQAFDFNDIPSNTSNNWELEFEISQYNKSGQVIETKKPNSSGSGDFTYYSTVYRNDLGNVLAEIVNAKYDECAFFTCDYDMNETVENTKYFDFNNGWFKKYISASHEDITQISDKPHFGLNTMYVKDSYGPAKIIEGQHLDKNKKYSFSAWVCPKDNTGPVTLGAMALSNDVWIDLSITFSFLQSNTWQCLINPITLPNDVENLVIWIGNGYESSTASDFYVDDIRFYPEDALATTTYYHPQWNQVVVNVDPNNHPDRKIEYDGYRRPVKWYKMRHNESDILVIKKEYHHRGFDE